VLIEVLEDGIHCLLRLGGLELEEENLGPVLRQRVLGRGGQADAPRRRRRPAVDLEQIDVLM